ncbi:integral membrane protein MviN [Moraxella macacae 0408225]|uniref:Probable lipid II flippase MurJ n=1 Tax=Moraxella macacae 0408225 TaxID=1230338 RepID=L2F7G2_9GAMM|nr:murein biosynthesis integral membrane protein MurJ [Moraxella macacae]ELA09014.1 integral membrane protein MviN [Moraxella macacae 0408225]
MTAYKANKNPKNLVKSTAVVSFFTLISRILGLVRDMVFMAVFGASGFMDAFLVAFKIPNFLRRLFAEGAFAQAFIPVLTDYQQKSTFMELQRFIGCMSGVLLLFLSLISTGMIVFAPWVVKLFAIGFANDGEYFYLTVHLFQLMFPYLLLITLTAFAGSILQSYHRFIIPAMTPMVLNVCLIIFALYVAPTLYQPILALGYAVLLAGVLQLLLQCIPVYQQKLLILPRLDWQHQGVHQVLKSLLPAIFGVSVLQINLLLNTVIATFLPTGSVSWLYAAERMSELPLGLIGTAIGAVILPTLSRYSRDDPKLLQHTLDWACKWVMLLGLPASVALVQISQALMLALFARGEFDWQDAKMSGMALQAMSVGILPFMFIKVFAPVFFAQKNSKIPVKWGFYSVLANVLFGLGLLVIFRYWNIALHISLALATSLSAWVNATGLYYSLSKRQIFYFTKPWQALVLRFLLANVAMSVALQGLLNLFPVAQMGEILVLLAICIVAMIIYALVLLLSGFKINVLKYQ